MRDIFSKILNILTRELGETVSSECEEEACIVYLKLYNTYIFIHKLDDHHLRLYIAIEDSVNPDEYTAIHSIPYVKVMAPEGKNRLLTCDLYSKLVEVDEYVVDCINHLLEAFNLLRNDSGELLLRNLIDLVEELASSGLSGREVYGRLVEEYKVPEDIAEAIVEAFYESTDED